jgi:hypothetical protein
VTTNPAFTGRAMTEAERKHCGVIVSAMRVHHQIDPSAVAARTMPNFGFDALRGYIEDLHRASCSREYPYGVHRDDILAEIRSQARQRSTS